jgi:hypothetical protein
MSGKIDKTLVSARMYIEAGFIEEPIEGDLNAALFGDDEARMRIEEAMARYRYAEQEGSGERSVSGLSAADLIADPKARDQAKQAALHGELDQFLNAWGITGRPDQISASASILGEKLIAKYCLSERVLQGIAKAADAASNQEREALQTADILVNTYGRLLSRLVEGHFHPAQARAMLDEFFSWKAFWVLSRMRSFNEPKWKRIKDEEKLDALAVYILDRFDTEEINGMANELAEWRARHSAYGELSDWERSEMAHYASIQNDREKAMKVIGRLYNSQYVVEERYNETAYDNVSNDLSRIAQFALNEDDALRIADLIVSDAQNLFRFTIEDIDDSYAMRLSVLAKVYASRMGITRTKKLAANISDNFQSLLKHVDHQNRPEMELAFKASFSPDRGAAKKVFIRGKRILESAGTDIEELELCDEDCSQVLMAVVREMSLKDLENHQMALDLARTTARQVAQRIKAETEAIESESVEEPVAETEEQEADGGVEFAPPVSASEAKSGAAGEIPLEPVPIGPVAIGKGPYKEGDPAPEGIAKAIDSIERGFSNLPPKLQSQIVEDIWSAATSSEENMRLLFRDGRLTLSALSTWRAGIGKSFLRILIGDREPTLGNRIFPDDFQGDAMEYLPGVIEEMRVIDTLFARLQSDVQERIAKAIITYQRSPFQDGKLTAEGVMIGHGLARGLAKKVAHVAPPVSASRPAEPIKPVRPTSRPPVSRSKSRASIPPPHSFNVRRTIMEKFNLGAIFIDEAVTRMAETHDMMKRRAALLTLINVSAQSLRDRFSVLWPVAFAMLEERILSNIDHYFGKITTLPMGDQDVLKQAIEVLSHELVEDVARNSLEGHDVKVREVAIRLSKWIDAEDAMRLASRLAPFMVDDDDCERVAQNYLAVLEHLSNSIHKDSAKQIAMAVRLEGDRESAIESAKRYTRHLRNVSSQQQFTGIDMGQVAEIFNIALGMRLEYEVATIRAVDIAKSYMDALKALGQNGIWHAADEMALYVSTYDDPSEPLEFILEAYGEVVGYLESKDLSKNVEARLAAVICKRVLEMNRTRSGGPSRIMRVYAAQHFDIYDGIYSALREGGLEKGLAVDRAIALTSVYDESRTPFIVRMEIAKHRKPDGGDDGGAGGQAGPVAGGAAPESTPTSSGGGTTAASAFSGIVRNIPQATESCSECDAMQMGGDLPILFPVINGHTTMMLGARVAMAAPA